MVRVKSFFVGMLRGLLSLALVVSVCALIGAGIGYFFDGAFVGAIFGGVLGALGFVKKASSSRSVLVDRSITTQSYMTGANVGFYSDGGGFDGGGGGCGGDGGGP